MHVPCSLAGLLAMPPGAACPRQRAACRFQYMPQSIDPIEPSLSAQAARPATVYRFRWARGRTCWCAGSRSALPRWEAQYRRCAPLLPLLLHARVGLGRVARSAQAPWPRSCSSPAAPQYRVRRPIVDTDQMLANVAAYRALAPVEGAKSTVWLAPQPFTTEGAPRPLTARPTCSTTCTRCPCRTLDGFGLQTRPVRGRGVEGEPCAAGAMKWPHYAFAEGAYADGDVIAKRLKTPLVHESASSQGSFHCMGRRAAPAAASQQQTAAHAWSIAELH